MKKILFISFLGFIACSSPADERTTNRPAEWHGSWKAEWETPPESYPEVQDMEFYMTGIFQFTEDSLTKTVNGYPGCIFAIDTLSHTQSWYVSGDTLFLMNAAESAGMTYRIASKTNERIQLQLMEDIFVTLSK
ncbi:hypothetical protein [Ekhidna sp. To15]|uniref:hypothetical protein n=1 Tax=Ekhidna sp. To15 TaxID=3395267 RepID=UPI003F5246F5